MVTQVENKIKELKALKRKEYYKQKDADLQNWGIAKDGKGKKATPIVVSDDEYEALIKISNGVGKTGRNTVAIILNRASVAAVVIGALVAIFSLISGANTAFVGSSIAGFGFALVFKGLSEAIRLLQQILDGGNSGVPEAAPEEAAAPVQPMPAPAYIATPNGFVPVQPPVYQAPYQQPYYMPAAQPAPAQPVAAPTIVTAPAEAPKANDYSSMPEFDFNPQDGFFANNYAPKETFGENR